jgi:hypothetical protein
MTFYSEYSRLPLNFVPVKYGSENSDLGVKMQNFITSKHGAMENTGCVLGILHTFLSLTPMPELDNNNQRAKLLYGKTLHTPTS